ncbi:hypothetical protein K491DRAFT_679897 [Lophiostoma macrostomum CBS 122681]|uniref:Amidoligase enzyme n=1 Tax=Lophiostoma macrostomum CBS 122681 TaxID=1314788 RepID=A0A6A6T4V2_9PLEO|nr:hypothetical protein K491DRAFT_679897 [Lophiostoma macrostomum CBS 122681]
MASSAIAGSTGLIHFGIEIELVIAPKQNGKYQDWEQAVSDLCAEIKKGGPAIDYQQTYDRKGASYTEWLIVEEFKIGGDKDKSDSESSQSDVLMFEDAESAKKKPPKYFVIELISPKYKLTNKLAKDITTIWKAAEKLFTITPHEGCGTHIHVSCNQWHLTQYKNIAKAIIGCETTIDSGMPEHRNKNMEHCKSNSKHTSLAGKAPATVAAEIDNTSNVEELVALMCPKRDGDYDRDFKWNFTGLLPGSERHTIEFRQPPVSQSASDSVKWIQVTTGFLEAAAAGVKLETLRANWLAGPKL